MAQFLQSKNDFPVQVTLGEKVPAWGLSRWNGNLQNGDGLRFVPSDDEGFTFWGDRQRLIYRGRKRSHRFTILGDTSFEYDCILNREPESNVITLFMEGAERFDFFRQPYFLKNPLLAGSYAVYKKETLIGEGTGKLCHIHRPEIIDSRGRRVWGDLSVVGNRLCIAIPETWLSEAKYPVIVDPVIGLSSLGALGPEDESEDENSYWGFNDWSGMGLTWNMGVNQFTAPHNITGNCTAHLYVDYYPGGYHWSTTEEKVWPVLYTHDSVKDRPDTIKSGNGGYISNDVGRTAGPPRGWRNTGITVDGNIQQGQVFWFGFFFWYVEPRFDYGGRLYRCNAWPYQSTYAGVRQKFNKYPMNIETGYYDDENGNEIEYEEWVEPSYELKISMYLEYSVPSTNYTRTLTQGVRLTDTRKPNASYKRAVNMNANGITLLGRASDYYRKHLSTMSATDTVNRFRGFFRSLAEHVQTSDLILYCRDFLRAIGNIVLPLTEGKRNISARRDITTEAHIQDNTARQRGVIRTILAGVAASDYAGKIFALLRTVREEAAAFGEAGHLGDYLRGIYTEAGIMAETNHAGDYHRTVEDTAHNEGVSLRHLFIFLRLVTLSLVRDYITGRFLKSKEELVIKSPVCREIIKIGKPPALPGDSKGLTFMGI
jgi:hypothetical protein